MSEDAFASQRLRTGGDVEQYLELVRMVWSDEVGVDRLAKKLIDHHPGMTLDNVFVVRHKGKMVSTLNLIPTKWSIGGCDLKVAEMGHVGTLPEYRRKGLIRRLVDEFHRQVEEKGYDLSVIEGIPYFYRQFGYEYAIPLLEETRIRLDQIPDLTSKARIRPFTQKDIPQAMKLLEHSQRKFYVHSVRDKTIWTTQQETGIASDPEPFEGHALEEEGELAAYFRTREDPEKKELILTEVSEVDQLEAQAVLRFLRDLGLEHKLETLSARVSYEEPFSKQLAALGGTKRTPPYAWQIRVTDHLRIFQKLKPLFEQRLASSMYRRLTETLSFNLRNFIIRVSVRNGKITDIKRINAGERSPIGLNPPAFVQLLTGYRSREDLELAVPDVSVAPSHKHLVDVLFPKLPSYIHSAY